MIIHAIHGAVKAYRRMFVGTFNLNTHQVLLFSRKDAERHSERHRETHRETHTKTHQVLNKNALDKNFGFEAERKNPVGFSTSNPSQVTSDSTPWSSRQAGREVPPVAPFSPEGPDLRVPGGSYEGSKSPRKS